MAWLYGQQLSRTELLRRVGRLEQIAGIEPCTLRGGQAEGVQALHVRSGGGLEFTVLPDRCLDIQHLGFRGLPLCWLSRTGIVAPQYYQPEDLGFLRSFSGGLLTTCGLRNFGPACTVDGETHPMHGRVAHLPAGNVTWGATWDGDECRFWIEGTVRESRVFGEDLTLHRRIETQLGSASLRIVTTVRNEGWQDEGHMILFHINPGFPLLDDGARLLVDPLDVHPRDADARAGLDLYDRFEPPQAGFREQVFVLDLRPDAGGFTTATLVNDRLDGGLGLRLRFRKEQLPWMVEWRQLGEGTYVLGLEPVNCPTVEGRAEAARRGTLPILCPGEERRYEIEVDVLSGERLRAMPPSHV